MGEFDAIAMLEQYRDGLLEMLHIGAKYRYSTIEEKEVWFSIPDHEIYAIRYELEKIEAVLSFCKSTYKSNEDTK